MSARLLDVRDLAIEFTGREGPTRVVDGVSFALDRREILGVVGESGSGKTLTCRALMRLLPPRGCHVRSGEILVDGRDVLTMDEAELARLRGERLAMIFQNPTAHLDPVMRIGDQIAEGLIRHRKLGRRAARARAVALLDEVGIRDADRQVDAYPHQFSGGMRQRAMIAAALACEPALLIADEPTTALDVTIQAQILDLLHGLRDRHDLAIVLVSHDLALVAAFCDRVFVMQRGRIVEAGTATDVVERPRHPYTVRLIGAQPQLAAPGQYFPIEGAPPEAPPGPAQRDAPLVLRVDALEVAFSRPRGLLDWARRRPRETVRAVDGVSLTLVRTEALGIVGESGSGKSTLARAIVRLVQPSGGDVILQGESLRDRRPAVVRAWRRRVQLIFQDPLACLNPRLTVAQAIAEPLRVHGLCPAGEVEARVRELMAEVGLDDRFGARGPHQLSGGQCQRVGIARALAMSPDVLIADEPTSALDVTIQAQILNLLMRLRATRQLSLIFISHDLAVVRHLCERVLVMERGRIVERGATEDVFARPSHPYTQTLLRAVPTFTLDGPASVTEHGTRVAASAR